MKSKCTFTGSSVLLCLGAMVLLTATVILSSCGDTAPLRTQYQTPKFLVAINDDSGPQMELWPVDASTGALGAAVSGSPFDLGVELSDPYAVATHPKHGNWVYVCDWDGVPLSKVVAVSLGADGTPTVLNTANTSTDSGCDYTYGMTITPDGKYLYTADYGSTNVSMFSIDQSTGQLTGLGTAATGLADDADSITATDSFVFVSANNNQIATLAIGTDGTLSCPTAGCATAVEDGAVFDAIAVDRSGKFLVAASEGSGSSSGANVLSRVSRASRHHAAVKSARQRAGLARPAVVTGAPTLYGYSIYTDGSLTSAASVDLTNGSWFGQIAFSMDNKSVFVTDESVGLFAFTYDESTGTPAALTGSPYPTINSDLGAVAVDPSNKFVYANDDWTNPVGWARDATTGALTVIGSATEPLATSALGDICGLTVTY